MEAVREFGDERQRAWCIHCGQLLAGVRASADHVPSKGLLRKPYPTNLPTISVCNACNNSFSADEEYLIALVGSVLAGTTDPQHQASPRARHILGRNERLRRRIDRSRSEYRTVRRETRVVWRPEQERVSRVAVKNARGHVLFELGEPMFEEPAHVWTIPLESLTATQRCDFESIGTGHGAWPEVGSRMMTRVLTGQDLSGSWVMVQEGVYRYAVAYQSRVLVRSVIHDYLATEVCWG
jgi:hypothetical protein